MSECRARAAVAASSTRFLTTYPPSTPSRRGLPSTKATSGRSSLEQVLGREIFVRLHGDWRQYQEKDIRDTLADDATRVWVAGLIARQVSATALTPASHELTPACRAVLGMNRARIGAASDSRQRSSVPVLLGVKS